MQELDTGRLAAMILAGGESSRMGELKALMPFEETTVIGRVIDAFRGAGVERVVVVTGHRGEEIERHLAKVEAPVAVVRNAHWREGMFSSVCRGLREIMRSDLLGFLMSPVDFPLLRPSIVRRVLDVRETHDPVLIQPMFGDTRGHPPLISASIIPEILAYDGTGGLKRMLNERYPDQTYYLPFDEASIVTDIDTREDYRRAIELWQRIRAREDRS